VHPECIFWFIFIQKLACSQYKYETEPSKSDNREIGLKNSFLI